MDSIPTEDDWGEYNSGRVEDLDLKYAHGVFAGKSNEEMREQFKENVLMRITDLRWMPIKPFQYYIFGLRDYVIKQDFGFYDSSDAASAFLGLLLEKLKEKPDHIRPILSMLMTDIEYVANNQELYEADEDIYGDFMQVLAEIKQINKNA